MSDLLAAEEKAGDKMRRPEQYLQDTGWLESLKKRRPVDAQGAPLPWYTYPCIAFLARRVQAHWDVFEYGSGYSTLWWAARTKSVVSCEHNAEWSQIVTSQVPPNVLCVYKEPGAGYADEVFRHERKFHVIVVDGEERLECGQNAVQALTEDGIIVWDNAEKKRYQKSFDGFFAKHGFRHIGFDGPGPQLERGWRTSILYRSNNCLSI